MSQKTGLNPTTAALLLSAIVAVSGQPAGTIANPADHGASWMTESAVAPTTRTTPAPTNAQQQISQALIGDDGRRRRYTALNPKRAARRLLERAGYITSGRDWRRFMKMTHHDSIAADLFRRALQFVTT